MALAQMLVRPAPFLCLDEPTNHLDLASRDRPRGRRSTTFAGTIVFISHDRYFINRLATKVVEVAGGRLVTHLGKYDDYHAATGRPPAGREEVRPVAPGTSVDPASRERARGAATQTGEGASPDRGRRRTRVDPAVRELRRRVGTLETEIHTVEARLEELGGRSATPPSTSTASAPGRSLWSAGRPRSRSPGSSTSGKRSRRR